MEPQQLPNRRSNWRVHLRRYRFGILLASLLGMMVYSPLAELIAPRLSSIVTRLLLGIVFGWLTISAVYAVSAHRGPRLVALILGVPFLVAEILDVSLSRDDTHIVSHILCILFLGHIVIVLVRFILRQSRIVADTIFASLCIYLLLGIIFAFVYSLLERFQPGAFSFSLEIAAEEGMRFGSGGMSAALYFSIVTMTTLGYGDILPVSAAARSLASLQAVIGQLYLTVLVAWLVGLHIAHSRFGEGDRIETPTLDGPPRDGQSSPHEKL